MVAVKIDAEVGEDRKLIVQLPDNIPPGKVELIVRSSVAIEGHSERERVRAKLRESGLLVEFPADLAEDIPLTEEELSQLGYLPPDARPSSALIDEDRGDY